MRKNRRFEKKIILLVFCSVGVHYLGGEINDSWWIKGGVFFGLELERLYFEFSPDFHLNTYIIICLENKFLSPPSDTNITPRPTPHQ